MQLGVLEHLWLQTKAYWITKIHIAMEDIYRRPLRPYLTLSCGCRSCFPLLLVSQGTSKPGIFVNHVRPMPSRERKCFSNTVVQDNTKVFRQIFLYTRSHPPHMYTSWNLHATRERRGRQRHCASSRSALGGRVRSSRWSSRGMLVI